MGRGPLLLVPGTVTIAGWVTVKRRPDGVVELDYAGPRPPDSQLKKWVNQFLECERGESPPLPCAGCDMAVCQIPGHRKGPRE